MSSARVHVYWTLTFESFKEMKRLVEMISNPRQGSVTNIGLTERSKLNQNMVHQESEVKLLLTAVFSPYLYLRSTGTDLTT